MRDNYRVYDTDAYMYDNTARQLEPETQPQTRERIYKDGRRVQESQRELRNRDRALQMNGGYVFFLAVISVFCLAMGVVYVGVESEISATLDSVASLKSDINTMIAENDATEYKIGTYISSDYIIKTATQELGMVEADSDQVSFYKKADSEYTVQYDDIPEE